MIITLLILRPRWAAPASFDLGQFSR